MHEKYFYCSSIPQVIICGSFRAAYLIERMVEQCACATCWFGSIHESFQCWKLEVWNRLTSNSKRSWGSLMRSNPMPYDGMIVQFWRYVNFVRISLFTRHNQLQNLVLSEKELLQLDGYSSGCISPCCCQFKQLSRDKILSLPSLYA